MTAVPELLKQLSLLSGVIVTADAMHCQRRLSEQIDGKGQYVLAVEGNQKALYDDIHFMMKKEADALTVNDSGHGRIETRSAAVITDLGWLQESHQQVLSTVGQVTRCQKRNGKTTKETAYYLLSEVLSGERIIDVTRQHWVLDTTFKEDDHRTRRGHWVENLYLMRKLALSMIEKAP